MVLIDSNDHKIHATVKKENVNQFDPFFPQGGSSILTNFNVNHSLGSQRTTSGPLQHYFLFNHLCIQSCRSCFYKWERYTQVNFEMMIIVLLGYGVDFQR
ncbi:unnamed protein product, partial [Thlaspi arvense]